jgi:hypothetical protein
MNNYFFLSRALVLSSMMTCSLISNISLAQADISKIPSQKHQLKNKLIYYTIGDEIKPSPEKGFKLLVILPGGDGSVTFTPFIKRIYQNCLDEDYLVIQLIARKWSKKQFVVWPTEKLKVKGMKTSTEEFISLAINDLKKRTKIKKSISLQSVGLLVVEQFMLQLLQTKARSPGALLQ